MSTRMRMGGSLGAGYVRPTHSRGPSGGALRAPRLCCGGVRSAGVLDRQAAAPPVRSLALLKRSAPTPRNRHRAFFSSQLLLQCHITTKKKNGHNEAMHLQAPYTQLTTERVTNTRERRAHNGHARRRQRRSLWVSTSLHLCPHRAAMPSETTHYANGLKAYCFCYRPALTQTARRGTTTGKKTSNTLPPPLGSGGWSSPAPAQKIAEPTPWTCCELHPAARGPGPESTRTRHVA